MNTLLFYINSIHDGGAERVIIQLAKNFALAGYRSILVTSFVDKNEYEVPACIERISIEPKVIKQNKIYKNYNRICCLRKIIKEERPLAVISFMAEANIRSFIATRGLGTKCIVSVRNDPEKEYQGLFKGVFGKSILPFVDGCVFQTEDAKKWFSKRLQKKSAVITNAVDQIFFEQKYKGGKDIINLGRLEEQKNQKMLIRSFANIADEYPDSNLIIYGIGSLKSELENQIKNLNMKNRVFLKGLTDEVPEVLSTAALFVLSSDYEGMPNALLEALAIGVPSISTDCPCGGPRSVIKNGDNGILVPVNNVTKLTEAMNNMLSDRVSAISMGEHARRKSLQFHPKRVFLKWEKYIERIIKSSR